MTEPREEDDVALDKDSECEDCGCFMWECVCNEPDEPYDVIYADQERHEQRSQKIPSNYKCKSSCIQQYDWYSNQVLCQACAR